MYKTNRTTVIVISMAFAIGAIGMGGNPVHGVIVFGLLILFTYSSARRADKQQQFLNERAARYAKEDAEFDAILGTVREGIEKKNPGWFGHH